MIIEFDIYWTRCHMTVKLDEICKTEGRKVKVENRAGKLVPKTEYPAQKRRKLFKLIIENNCDEILDDVEQYLTENSKTFGQEFAGLRR